MPLEPAVTNCRSKRALFCGTTARSEGISGWCDEGFLSILDIEDQPKIIILVLVMHDVDTRQFVDESSLWRCLVDTSILPPDTMDNITIITLDKSVTYKETLKRKIPTAVRYP